MTKQQRDNIGRFIRKVAERTPTDALIAFVAANFGMLPACQKIIELLVDTNSDEREWLKEQCHNFHIGSQLLQSESERVLSIFQPGLSHDEQYTLLDLSPDATISEVKSAFRKLSFHYHPDSSTTKNPDDSTKFIAICRAYKKIMRTHEAQVATLDSSEKTPWRYDTEPKQPSKQSRKTIFLIAAIAVVLIFISLSATRSYRRKAMLNSLGCAPKVAAVQPPQKTASAANPPETTRPPVEKTASKVAPVMPKSTPSPTIFKPTIIVKKQAPAASKVIPATPKLVEKPILIAKKTTPPRVIPVGKKQLPLKAKTILPKPVEKTQSVEVNVPVVRTPETTRPPVEKKAVAKVITPTPKPPLFSSDTLQAASLISTLPRTFTAPPLRSRIDTFIAAYTRAYELRDMTTFATFFTDNAKENNIPFKEKHSQYRELFVRLKEIAYKVTPLSWHSEKNIIYLSARFHAYFLYFNGEAVNIHGTTSFKLLEDKDHNLKVKNLTYTVD